MTIRPFYLTIPALMLLAGGATAQTTGVGIGIVIPNTSAALDVSSTTKGLLVPRMDSAQRASIASPATGLLVYQTDGVTPGFYYRNATGWAPVSTPAVTDASTLSTGTLPDARLSTNVTQQGNTFNTAGKLVQLDGTGALPALSGANLSGLNAGNISTGTLGIANGGTGQSTATAALNALLPIQTGNAGKVLGTTGTTAAWQPATSTNAFNTAITFVNSGAGPTGIAFFLNPLSSTVQGNQTTQIVSGSGVVNGMIVPAACTLVALKVAGNNYYGNGQANTATVKVVVNGVFQPMQLALTVPALGKAAGVTTANPVSLQAGDILSVTYQETTNLPFDAYTIQLYFQ